jgi:hypothetical protein
MLQSAVLPPLLAFPGVFLPQNSMDLCVPRHTRLPPPRVIIWHWWALRFLVAKHTAPPAAIVTLGGFHVPPGAVASLGGGTKAGVANTGFAISKSPRRPKIGAEKSKDKAYRNQHSRYVRATLKTV